MKTRIALSLIIVLTTIFAQRANAQQTRPPDELPKLEVGIETISTFTEGGNTHLGAGARITYNLNRHFAIEGATYFSPGRCLFCNELTGRMTQGMVGIKAGQRFKRFGLFVKARPGVVNLSQAEFDLVATGSSQPFLPGTFAETPFRVINRSRTDFAVDVGGVFEVYATKKFFLRFDTGLLIERIKSRTFHGYTFNEATGSFQPLPSKIPGETIGHFQFVSGVGFRF